MIKLFKKFYKSKYFAPGVIVFGYLVLLLDTFKYPGFVGKHFFVDAKVLAFVTLIFLIITPFEKNLLQRIQKLNMPLVFFLSLAYLFLSILNYIHFKNYVFSKFHIHMGGLPYLLVFSFLALVLMGLRAIRIKKLSGKEIVKFLLEINRELFPYIILVSYLLVGIESFTYIGFLRKFIFVDSRFLLCVSVVSIVLLAVNKFLRFEYKSSKIEAFIMKFGKIMFPLTLVLYLVMEILNTVRYKNYVFSIIHLNPDIFANVVYLSFVFPLLTYAEKIVSFVIGVPLITARTGKSIKHGLGEKKFKPTPKDLITAVCFLALFGFVISNFTKTFKDTFGDLVFITTHLNYSYDEKMQAKWGTLYRLIALVRGNTRPGDLVLLPANVPPHSVDGRLEYYRYFIGERKLVNYSANLNFENFDYVVVTKGYMHAIYDGLPKQNYIWPDFQVKAEKVVYLEYNNGNFVKKEFDGNYNPDNFKNLRVWGIIKVKK